jgi:hypothetical protein
MTLNTIQIILGLISFGFVACETVVDPRLEVAEPIMVVDAWVNNLPQPQVVRLTMTQPYFENSLPPGVTGATVTVVDSNGKEYFFEESVSDPGAYVWTPPTGEVFGETGLRYTLTILAGSASYQSSTVMGRVPPIDSITFRKEDGNQFVPDLYLAEFWAVDPVEPGDTYWIKTWKNGRLLSKPAELNLAYDAAFSRGGNFSGVNFIAPIRTAINPFDQDKNGNLLSPYVVGDSLYVEIHSLSEAAFDFMVQVQIQTDRPGGFAELFSTPLANVSSNIESLTPGKKAVGFFNVAAVSGLGRKFSSLDDVTKK